MKSLIKRIPKFIIDSGDYTKTVFVAGTGRSGTTWVMNVLNSRGDYRLMFEPFQAKRIALLNHWNYRQYLRANEKNTAYLDPAKTILSGQIRNKWIDQYNHKTICNQRIIKDIRANLILHWIKINFPEIPIVLILRHPCAVANSKLSLGWETHLEDFFQQSNLVDDFLAPYMKQISSYNTTFEKHVLMWCIENYVPLQQFNPGDIHIAFYENLCTTPQSSFSKMFSYIGLNAASVKLKNLNLPSPTSRKNSSFTSGAVNIEAWRENISKNQVLKAVEILNAFGLDSVYGETSMPLVNGDSLLSHTY